jgi:hypothetical protein
MAMRIRRVNGTLVALCAVETDAHPDDIYFDDEVDHAVRIKLWRDFKSEGIAFDAISHPFEDALAETQKVRDAKESLEAWLKEQETD